jgi:transposase
MTDLEQKMIDEIHVRTHGFGKIELIINYLKNVGFDKLIDSALPVVSGHEPDIPHSIIGMIFIANLICMQLPLYRIYQMFLGPNGNDFDFYGTFGVHIDINKLTDDRFASFLDRLKEVGVRNIFTKNAINTMKKYEITPTDINSDTTSLVVWGEFDDPKEAEQSEFQIHYGHSKQKRSDKKQIKVGVETMHGGLVVDAHVLSGNADDKTYNQERVAEIKETIQSLLECLGFDGYFIADSAAATKDAFMIANDKGIKMITRLPDSYKVSKKWSDSLVENLDESSEIIIDKARAGQKSTYRMIEAVDAHDAIPLKIAAVFSNQLLKKKTQAVEKKVRKEAEKLEKPIQQENKKKPYACLKDAEKAEQEWRKKQKKLNFHDIIVEISEREKSTRGRPSKDPEKQKTEIVFHVTVNCLQKEKIEEIKHQLVQKECIFIVASNDLEISGEEMLRKYKTQSAVEIKFQQFKSRHFINSVFLKKTDRVETLMYLYLIALQACSVIEHVVRRELKEENAQIIDKTTRLKHSKPTFPVILTQFSYIGRQILTFRGEARRTLSGNLSQTDELMLKYLKLDKQIFLGIQ